MPIYVRASPPAPGKTNLFPKDRPKGWPDDQIGNAVRFAQISSAKSKETRTRREVIWVCSTGVPAIVFTFEKGRLISPKGKAWQPGGARFNAAIECISRSVVPCAKGIPANPDPEKLIKGRRRKALTSCPT